MEILNLSLGVLGVGEGGPDGGRAVDCGDSSWDCEIADPLGDTDVADSVEAGTERVPSAEDCLLMSVADTVVVERVAFSGMDVVAIDSLTGVVVLDGSPDAGVELPPGVEMFCSFS